MFQLPDPGTIDIYRFILLGGWRNIFKNHIIMACNNRETVQKYGGNFILSCKDNMQWILIIRLLL